MPRASSRAAASACLASVRTSCNRLMRSCSRSARAFTSATSCSQLAHRGGQVAFGVSPDARPGLPHRRTRQFAGRVLVDRNGELRLRVSDQLHRNGEPGLQGAVYLARRDAFSVSAWKRRQVDAALTGRDREAERGRLVIDPRSRQGEPEQGHVIHRPRDTRSDQDRVETSRGRRPRQAPLLGMKCSSVPPSSMRSAPVLRGDEARVASG